MDLVRGLVLVSFAVVACSGDNKPSVTVTAPSAPTVNESFFDDGDDGDDDDGEVEETAPTTAGPGATEATLTSGPTSAGPTTEAMTGEVSTTDMATTETATSAGPTTEPPGVCGDGLKDRGEACDLGDLGGQTCQDLGYVGGALGCSAGCEFDVSLCESGEACGDGVVDDGEACDCAGACSAGELGGATCGDLPSPKGTPFTGGALGCTGACVYDTAGCTWCGDAKVNSGEQCDGASLGGKTCASLGFSGGTLKCTGACAFDTTGCAPAATCGDGVCNAGEDPCSCEDDCPNDPNSCSPCECGSVSASCGCDLQCLAFNDCCANGPC